MAFYEGESLAQKIRKGPIPFRDAVDIAIEMAKGLEAAHARNIVHLDAKPSNVLITKDGLAKIVDFGLARVITSATMTQSGGTSGTVGYMSPEQSLGKAVDRRTDIWRSAWCWPNAYRPVAASARQCFFHRSSYFGRPRAKWLECRLNLQQHPFIAPSRRRPSHRYQSCSELRADLEKVRDSLPPATVVDPSAPTMTCKSAQFSKVTSTVHRNQPCRTLHRTKIAAGNHGSALPPFS